MDLFGFSLENYDWFGCYCLRCGRSVIDVYGELFNGMEFDGFVGFKWVVIE